MEVVRAKCAGACYGVQRALDMALEAGGCGKTAYTLGPLIHNPKVVQQLADRGVCAVADVDCVPLPREGEGQPTVIIRSHGVTPAVKRSVEALGLPVADATCPHVSRAQKAAEDLGQRGMQVVVVGEDGHPEVAALVAYAQETGAQVLVVADACDLPQEMRDPVGIVVQTTQKREVLDRVVAELQRRGIEPEVKNTICSATTKRQDSAEELARRADAMVVIGGRNSSNTTRLYEICAEACSRAHHVESVDELQPEWFADCLVVGVTAGASTPDDQIASVEEWLRSI